MAPSFDLVISVLLFYLSLAGSQRSIGILVTPDRNQTVPFSSDANVTYSCTVGGGRTAVWQVNGRQIVGQDQLDDFAESGFFVEAVGTRTSVVRISAEARRNATLNDPPGISVLCVAVKGLTGILGREFFVITFDPPIPPLGLNLKLIDNPAPTKLRLIWERPFNVDPQVDIQYSVEINSTQEDGVNYGPFENITDTFLPISFSEALHSNRSCQMYEFFVKATNDAGSSLPSVYRETLPITTDVTNISQTLRVDSVDLQDGRGVMVTVTFQTLVSCSKNFPIKNYTINLDVSSRGSPLSPSDLPPPGNPVSVNLNDSDIPGLRRDMAYLLNVTACSNFTCKESKSIPFTTSDLHSAQVVFFENFVYLRCVLARNSPAIGCSVRLSLATNPNATHPDITFDLLRMGGAQENGEIIVSTCNTSTNQKAAYDEERIVGVVIQEDGMLGSLLLPLLVSEVETAENFVKFTNCTLPQQGDVVDKTALAVTLPIVLLLLLVSVVITSVFVCIFLRQRRKYQKRPSVTTDHVDDDETVIDIKFEDDEVAKLLKPKVKRSSSAPVNTLYTTTTTATDSGPVNTISTSSSQNDEVFRDQGTVSRDGQREHVPFVRSVSENYKMVVRNTYELELDKRLLRLRFNRSGLRQYSVARRSTSDTGSALGSGGGGADPTSPRLQSSLKISEELQSLLSDDSVSATLHPVPEESEPNSPAATGDAETGSLLVPGRSDSGNKSNHSVVSFKSKKNSDGGSIKGL